VVGRGLLYRYGSSRSLSFVQCAYLCGGSPAMQTQYCFCASNHTDRRTYLWTVPHIGATCGVSQFVQKTILLIPNAGKGVGCRERVWLVHLPWISKDPACQTFNGAETLLQERAGMLKRLFRIWLKAICVGWVVGETYEQVGPLTALGI